MIQSAFIIEAPPVRYWNSNPYALAFSPDGSQLAMGSGGWYAGGGLSLIDVASGAGMTVRFAPESEAAGEVLAPASWEVPAVTISGVAFDGSGRFVAACGWSSSQHVGPALLFRVDTGELEHVATLPIPEPGSVFDRCPTGLALVDGGLFVRCNARRLEDVLVRFDMPEHVTADRHACRAHARVAVVGDELITGGGGSLKLGGWSIVEGTYESFKATTGIVVGMPPRGVPAPGKRVTSVLARPDGSLVTGGLDGELVAWERRDEWRPVRWLRDETERTGSIGGAWATYRPQSVVGLCALDDGRFFSVDASGEVLEWRDEVATRRFELPRAGTPRCLAVHPSTPRGPLLAVGVKAGDDDGRRGWVACFEV